MKPEDVPGELVKLACIGFWPGGKDEQDTAVIAYGNEMRAVLAAVLPAHEQMVRARIKALADDEPEPETDTDSCRLVDIDGETVRGRGSGEMDEQDQAALGEVFRAARARMKAAKDAERAEIERQVRAEVAEEIRESLVKDIKHYFAAADDPLYEDVEILCGRIERGEYGNPRGERP